MYGFDLRIHGNWCSWGRRFRFAIDQYPVFDKNWRHNDFVIQCTTFGILGCFLIFQIKEWICKGLPVEYSLHQRLLYEIFAYCYWRHLRRSHQLKQRHLNGLHVWPILRNRLWHIDLHRCLKKSIPDRSGRLQAIHPFNLGSHVCTSCSIPNALPQHFEIIQVRCWKYSKICWSQRRRWWRWYLR